MKTIDEFKDYYSKNIKDKIEIVEAERKKVINIYIVLLIILIVCCFINKDFAGPLILLFIWLSFKLKKKYINKFKEVVVNRILYFIDENLEYEKNNYVKVNEFDNSNLFDLYTDYKGENYVTGKIKGSDKSDNYMNIELSELNVGYRGKKGKSKLKVSIFKGLFYVVDFNKKISSYVKVMPYATESVFENKNLIHLEETEFSGMYQVYSSDQIEARYILSTSLMNRITEYTKKHNKKMYMSFKNDKVYIAISTNEKYFEPKVFKSLYEYNIIEEYYENFKDIIDIVEELNLNLDIYNK